MQLSQLIYLGNLRTECEHLKSGTTIITDAPTDKNGKGEAFSPTDLVATSAASCMLTILGIRCEKKGFTINSANASVYKVMNANPRRIAKIKVDVQISISGITKESRQYLEEEMLNSPVMLSLHPEIEKDVNFEFQDS